MAGAEAEHVDFVLRVLEQEKTKAALEAARNTAKSMTDEQKSAAIQAADAARRQVTAQQAANTAARTAAQAAKDQATQQAQNTARMYAHLEGMKSAYNLMTTIFRGAYEAARTLGEYSSDLNREYGELETAHSGFMRALADGVVRGGGFTNFIDGLTESFTRLTPRISAAAESASSLLQVVRLMVGISTGGVLGATTGRSGPSPVTTEPGEGWGVLGEYANLPQSTQENLDWQQGDVLPEGQTTLPQSWLGDQGVRSTGRAPRRSGGGGATAPSYEEYGPSQEEFLEQIQAESEAWAELNRQRRAEEDEINQVRADALETYKSDVEAQAELDAEAHQRRLEFVAEEKDQQQALRDYTREQVIGSVTAFATLAQTGSGIFSQLAAQQEQQINNITSVLQASGASQDAISRATASHTEKLDRIKKAEGGFLIAYNSVMAVTAVAQAASAYGEMRYDAMASFITAAAGYAAAAVMAGIRLGDDGSGGSTGATASTATPSFSSRTGVEAPAENTATNVTIFTWGYSNAGLGRQVERARWEYERSGGDADMLSGASGYGE
jgi:chemotaxis protein histidine kinase CheA